MLCLLMNSLWGESQSGQLLTSLHHAYFEGTALHKGGAPQIDHAWLVWDWNRDPAKLPFDASVGDPRLKGCEVCGAPLQSKRRHAVVCSTSCRVTRHRRRVGA